MTRHTNIPPPPEAIQVAGSIVYWLSVAAERGEWDFSPAEMRRLLLELVDQCLAPDGPSPEAAVREFVRVWGIRAGRMT